MSAGEFLLHPSWGMVELSSMHGFPPITLDQLPPWWNELDEDEQEERHGEFWKVLVGWIDRLGPSRTWFSPADPETLEFAEQRMQKTKYRVYEAPWSTGLAIELFSVNPLQTQIYRESQVLLEQYESWDGIVLYTEFMSETDIAELQTLIANLNSSE